jgi:hypothetical protein
VNTVVGSILFTFAVGGIADWIPAFLHRVDNFAIDYAGSAAVHLIDITGYQIKVF